MGIRIVSHYEITIYMIDSPGRPIKGTRKCYPDFDSDGFLCIEKDGGKSVKINKNHIVAIECLPVDFPESPPQNNKEAD